MTLIRLSLVILLLFPNLLWSQSPFIPQWKIDEIGKAIQQADSLVVVEPDKALLIYQQLFVLSKESNDDSLEVIISIKLGNHHQNFTSADSAAFYFQMARSISESLQDEDLIAKTYSAYAPLLEQQGDLEQAMELLQQALDIIQKYPDRIEEEMEITRSMAYVMMTAGFYDKALQYLFSVKKKSPFREFEMPTRLLNHTIAFAYMDSNRPDSAIYFYDRSVQDLDKDLYKDRYARYYNNVGICLEEKGEYAEAEQMYAAGLKLSKEIGATTLVYLHYVNICSNYNRWNKPEKVLAYALEGLELTRALGDRDRKRIFLSALKQAYEALGNFDKAFYYQSEEYDLALKILDDERRKRLVDVEAKYQAEKKTQQLALQQSQIKQQTTERNALLIGLVSLGILVFFIFRSQRKVKAVNKRLNQSNQTIQMQSDKLKRLDAQKSQFFVNISHDLRTPISLLHDYFQKMEADENSYYSALAERTMLKGKKNVNKLIQLTEEIKDLTLLEEGQMKLEYKSVSIKTFLSLLVELFRSKAESKEIGLIFRSEVSEALRVVIDPLQFEKIIYNLVSNAIKFSDDGEINIHLSANKDQFSVSVSDQGQGIPANQLAFVFDRFYQSTINDYNQYQGMGVGLYLVKELVELHNGEITVSSDEGSGTVFTFQLPINAGLDVPEYNLAGEYIGTRSDDENQASDVGFLKSFDEQLPTILVVDDHPEIQAYIIDQIGREYNILGAGEGRQALKLLEQFKVDLLVTDLMMPVMDGFELLRNTSEQYPDLPAMVVSARSSGADRNEILSLGINDFISKPFDKADFQLRIKNILSEQQKRSSSIKDHTFIVKEVNNKTLAALNELIGEEIANPDLGVPMICERMSWSVRQSFRMVKSLTDMSPLAYIKAQRLNYARQLLDSSVASTVTEIAKSSGYKNVTRFSLDYEKAFGKKPTLNT